MAKLSRQTDELSKEMGLLRLLEEQRKGASTQSTAVPVAVPAPGNASPIEQPPTGRPPPKCYYCGDIGHFIKDCEKKKNQYGRNNGVSQTDQDDVDSVRGQTYIRLVVNGKSPKCLLDTGSDVTLLPTSVVAGLRVESTTRRIRAANGRGIKVIGTATVEAVAGRHHMTITGLVSPHVSEVMLGIGFLKQEKAIWNFDLGEVVLGGYRHKLCSRGRQSWCTRVILQNDSVVPGESEMDVSTLVQYSDLSGPKSNEFVDWVTKAREVTAGVCVSGLSSQTAMKMCLFESLTSQGAQ